MNLENILITGSSGLVGTPLVTKLLNKSNLIVGIDPVINSECNENYKHISIPLNSVEDPENYLTYFMKIDKVKFKQKVEPDCTLIFKLKLLSPIRRGICHMEAKAYVDDTIVTEAELMAKIVKEKNE